MIEYAYASSFSVSILDMSDIFFNKKGPFPNFLHHLVDNPPKNYLLYLNEKNTENCLPIEKKHKILIRI